MSFLYLFIMTQHIVLRLQWHVLCSYACTERRSAAIEHRTRNYSIKSSMRFHYIH